MARWFRVYEDLVDDPKVQRLPPVIFRALINLWCLAAGNDGRLPPVADIAFKLRVTEDDTVTLLADLRKAGLIDEDEDGNGLTPHNWNGRQFKSDVSNERVKRHRQRHRNVTRNESATPPEAETDTEPETEAAQLTSPREEKVSRETPIIVEPNRYDRLEQELREAAGLTDSPSPALIDISPMVALLDAGYDLTKDILPKLREIAKRGSRGDTWAYYVKAVTEQKAKNGSIPLKPVAEIVTPMTWITNEDERWPALRARYREERGRDPPTKAGDGGMGWNFPSAWLWLDGSEALPATHVANHSKKAAGESRVAAGEASENRRTA